MLECMEATFEIPHILPAPVVIWLPRNQTQQQPPIDDAVRMITTQVGNLWEAIDNYPHSIVNWVVMGSHQIVNGVVSMG